MKNSNGSQGAGLFTYNYVGATEMLARLDLPNGTRTEQEYDSLHRLTRVKNLTGGGGTLASYAYGYDDRDVKTGVRANLGDNLPQEVGYFYDAVDQLVGERSTSMGGGGAAYSDYTNRFQYDSMGNRTRAENISIRGSRLTRTTPNDLNQIVASSTSVDGDEVQNSGFAYDASGNLTQATASDGSKTLYLYDEADRLVRIESRNVADAPTRKSEFTYDYASRKVVSKEFTYSNGVWSKSGEVRRVFDGLDVIQERNDANHATAHYTRDGNIGGILARTSESGHSYFHYDGGGNVTALSDETGVLVGRYAYDAFGNTLEASGARAAENPYRFSTKEFHAASGMVDFGFRFYLPGMGRWLNRDPIRESGGINLYGMVRNNPINEVDEYGLAGPAPELPSRIICSGSGWRLSHDHSPNGAGAAHGFHLHLEKGSQKINVGADGKPFDAPNRNKWRNLSKSDQKAASNLFKDNKSTIDRAVRQLREFVEYQNNRPAQRGPDPRRVGAPDTRAPGSVDRRSGGDRRGGTSGPSVRGGGGGYSGGRGSGGGGGTVSIDPGGTTRGGTTGFTGSGRVPGGRARWTNQ